MATNAQLVEQARKMGLTGYDKKTASVTGPGAVKTGQSGTARQKTVDAAGNYTGPVNDFGLTQRAGQASGGGTAYSHLDDEPMRENVRASTRAALKQQQSKIDEATRQAVQKLQQTQRQAQAGFQAQRDETAGEEAQALDNSALYAELRGDRGGIGRAQYDSIQNAAAKNRQAIRQAQAQLDADTSRQIAALCAQGEYEKANAVLEAAQQELTQLQDIEKLAADYNLNVDKLNNTLAQQERQWQTEQARTAVEDARYADETAYKRKQDALDREGQLAEAMLKNGMPLTETQRQALGLTEEQEAMLINLYAVQAAEKTTKRSGGSGGSGTGGSKSTESSLFAAAAQWAETYGGDPEDYVRANYKKYGFSSQSAALSGLTMYQTEQAYQAEQPKMTQQALAEIEAYRTPSFWEKLAGGMQSDWNKYEAAASGDAAASSLEEHVRKDYNSALALARRYGAEETAKPYLDRAVEKFYAG